MFDFVRLPYCDWESAGGGGRGLVSSLALKIINREITVTLAVQILPTATASLSTTKLLLHLITGGWCCDRAEFGPDSVPSHPTTSISC